MRTCTKTTLPGLGLDEFPDEVLLRVFGSLRLEDLPTRVRPVCRRWYFLSQDRYCLGRRPYVNVVVLGSAGAGKSSLITRLLLDNNDISLEQLSPFRASADILDMALPLKAFMYQNDGERDRGCTVDFHRKEMDLRNRMLVLIDTPGIRRYLKHQISGTMLADYAILVVSPRERDSTVDEDMERLRLLKIAGLRSVIVAVNKLDSRTHIPIQHSSVKSAFEHICQRIAGLLPRTGLCREDVTFIPASALHGTNMLPKICPESEEGYSWWGGLSLLEMIRATFVAPPRLFQRQVRVAVDRTYKVSGIGTVLCGMVVQGVVRPGQWVRLSPINQVTQIKSLQLAIPKTPVASGMAGDYIAMAIRGRNVRSAMRRRVGVVTGFLSEQELFACTKRALVVPKWRSLPASEREVYMARRRRNAAVYPCTQFTAKVYLFAPAGRIQVGYEPILHVQNGMCRVRVKEYQLLGGGTPHLSNAGLTEKAVPAQACITFEVRCGGRALSLERSDDCRELGRFVLREGQALIGGGVVEDVVFEGDRGWAPTMDTEKK